MRWAVVAALSFGVAGAARAEVQVQQRGDRVTVRATAAPVSEILDRIARQTGMKVVYDGGAPRAPISVSFGERSQVEAVLGVLEGLGLNYLLKMDASGTRIETLMIEGPAGPGANSPGATGAALPAGPAGAAPRFPNRGFGPGRATGVAPEPADDEESDDADVEEDVPPVAAGNPPGRRSGQGDEERQQPGGPPATLPMPNYPASPFAPQATPQPPTPAPTPNRPSQNDAEDQ